MKKLLLYSAVLFLTLPGVTLASGRELSSKKVCEVGKPRCVELVIKEMERRYKPLEKHCDHNALFALGYLRTTETFLKTLDDIDYDNLASVIREDALFSEYYFRAYDAYHLGSNNIPPAWRQAFEAAQSRSVTSSGDLVLGFNAHIQRDLPFVLYDLYKQGHPVNYENHTRVNEFLQTVNFLEELAQKFDPTIDDEDVPGDSDDIQRFQLIASWRELAYRNFEKLRDAGSEEARAQVAAEIETYAEVSAQILRQQLGYAPGTDSSERDAYCRANTRGRS
jgi:Family of unknown function (DUF5995)